MDVGCWHVMLNVCICRLHPVEVPKYLVDCWTWFCGVRSTKQKGDRRPHW